MSFEYTLLINQAYRTLKDRVERAKYLLNINGIEYDEDQKKTDQQFLIESMEALQNTQLEGKDFYKVLNVWLGRLGCSPNG